MRTLGNHPIGSRSEETDGRRWQNDQCVIAGDTAGVAQARKPTPVNRRTTTESVVGGGAIRHLGWDPTRQPRGRDGDGLLGSTASGLKRNKAAAVSASKRSQRAECSRAESASSGLDRARAHAQGPESPAGTSSSPRIESSRRWQDLASGGRDPAKNMAEGGIRAGATKIESERSSGRSQIEDEQQRGGSAESRATSGVMGGRSGQQG